MNDSRIARSLFGALWFVAVPAGGAFLIVHLLSAPGAAADGVLGPLRTFAREQPVPLWIVLFTILDMVLWSFRHDLPGAAAVALGGRADVPAAWRRRLEEAGHLLDETELILAKRRAPIEKTVAATRLEELHEAMATLRATMAARPFEPEAFEPALEKTEQTSFEVVGRWRKSALRDYAESIGLAVGVALVLRAFVVEAFKIPSPSMVPTLQVGDHIFVNKSSYGVLVPFTDTRMFSKMPPAYGDVIVFQFPERPEQDFIKRVVARRGDKLEALDGRPIINGWRPPECKVGTYRYEWGDGFTGRHEGDLFVEYLGPEAFLTFYDASAESYADLARRTCDRDADCDAPLACRAHLCGIAQGPYFVKPGEVWVMGDNRNNSHDSRGWFEGKGGGVPFDFVKGRALVVWLSFLPGGGIAWDRIGIDVMGRPKMPPSQASLQPAIDRCMRERPPLAETTPPSPR